MSIFEALSSWTSRNDQSAWHCTAIVDHQMQSSNFFFQHSSGFALLWPDLKLAYALLSAWVFIAVSEPVQRPSKAKGFLLILFWLRSQIYIRFKKKKNQWLQVTTSEEQSNFSTHTDSAVPAPCYYPELP